MPEHTPGPWTVGKGALADCVMAGDPPQVIAETWYAARKGSEIRANARLIAAAPDLLVACEAGLKALEAIVTGLQESGKSGWEGSLSWEQNEMAAMRAAIAKARGDAP